ncbi:hypothetical protein CHS0354_007557 [Potamilus streckersoni]|uniref:Uncharacterized protein n=1 Tax=Potamilus streckersoni TaxID=2493646 RepID=A0AAE0T4A3_9BIVA|nr:hypothetical protein CHS0354_007557 [Potamilus streckersoni]
MHTSYERYNIIFEFIFLQQSVWRNQTTTMININNFYQLSYRKVRQREAPYDYMTQFRPEGEYASMKFENLINNSQRQNATSQSYHQSTHIGSTRYGDARGKTYQNTEDHTEETLSVGDMPPSYEVIPQTMLLKSHRSYALKIYDTYVDLSIEYGEHSKV